MSSIPQVIMVVGPTAIGKTRTALRLAQRLHCPIISADSRQIYREMPIGTAAPTSEEQQLVKHYMVGVASVLEDYSVARYEATVMELLYTLFKSHESVVICGGSMLYLDAIKRGIDPIPSVAPEVRRLLKQRLSTEGVAPLREELKLIDPQYYNEVDLANAKRIVHALEVYYTSGKPYSSFRKGVATPRPFKFYTVYLEMPRESLYDRINRRTQEMLREGWLREALSLYPHRDRNALNTIGYKELFFFFDEVLDRMRESKTLLSSARKKGNESSSDSFANLEERLVPIIQKIEKNPLSLEDSFLSQCYQATVDKIQSSTRQYARQQIIRFRQDDRAIRFSPSADVERLLPLLSKA